jgi:hypothetical protein
MAKCVLSVKPSRKWKLRFRTFAVQLFATVYRDEPGFSGNNLLDRAHTFFVFAAFAMER